MSDERILAIDTATTVAVVALGDAAGRLIAEQPWVAGYRHGEELLPRIEELLGATATPLASLAAIVVGTGPGAFTGLRVGIATAKGLAHALSRRIIGVSTADALLDAASAADGPANRVLLLPAGPSDRVAVRAGDSAQLIPGGMELTVDGDEMVVAVDLPGRAAPDDLGRGDRARAGLAAALVRLAAAKLHNVAPDDLATLVPEYVTLPRGVRAATGEVTWSRDHR